MQGGLCTNSSNTLSEGCTPVVHWQCMEQDGAALHTSDNLKLFWVTDDWAGHPCYRSGEQGKKLVWEYVIWSEQEASHTKICRNIVPGRENSWCRDVVAGQMMAPRRCPAPDPWNLWIKVTYMAEGMLQLWVSEKPWGEIILDYLRRLGAITKVLIRDRQEGQGER